VEVEGNTCKKVRIAVGSAAPTVVRCKKAEQALQGSELTEEAIKAASEAVLDDISPIDDIRATAWYRKKVAPVVVRKAIEEALAVK
jgi:CO/xanthine dehydrogenase FAD-binding subunit